MTREEALNVIWLRCQHNDKTYEAYCVLKHEQQPCDDATLKDIFCMGCEYKEQQPCDKCVYSTSEGCQYDDITETIPPFEDCISRDELLKAIDTWDKFGYTETGCFVREPKNDCVKYIHYDDVIECIKGMSSVNPQKPICPSAGVDCEDCPAYEPKILNKWIGAEVLDRIRNEMHATAEKHEDGVYYLRDEWIDEIIDKYKAESEET